jgi:hypothetical protein
MITIGQTERWDSNQFCVAHEAAAAVPARSPGSVFGPHPTHDVEGDREGTGRDGESIHGWLAEC